MQDGTRKPRCCAQSSISTRLYLYDVGDTKLYCGSWFKPDADLYLYPCVFSQLVFGDHRQRQGYRDKYFQV
jgi:hypothetical protein